MMPLLPFPEECSADKDGRMRAGEEHWILTLGSQNIPPQKSLSDEFGVRLGPGGGAWQEAQAEPVLPGDAV